MTERIAIVGAGVVGRLLALRLADAGRAVTLFDRGMLTSRTACSYTAAGLLAPVAEAAHAVDAEICQLGLLSMALWEEILPRLSRPVTFRRDGTLALVRDQDQAELVDLSNKIKRRLPDARCIHLTEAELAALEPALAGSGYAGLYFAEEGRIHNHEAMAALGETLEQTSVRLRLGVEVRAIEPGAVITAAGQETYALVIDCRGFGARQDVGDLRGVRGELVQVHAPEVVLTRPVRILHQRYPIYIVPRGEHTYAVGATCLESESLAPVTVIAALELLGALSAVHPGFRYGEITGLYANCRPAFADNRPRIRHREGLLRVNGLFRHGFLYSPIVTAAAAAKVLGETLPTGTASLFERESA